MSQPVIRVTVTDLQTGQASSRELNAGDYMLIPTGPAYLSTTQVRANGATHVLTVKGCRPQRTAAPAAALADVDLDDGDEGCCGMHGLICHISEEPCCSRCPGEEQL